LACSTFLKTSLARSVAAGAIPSRAAMSSMERNASATPRLVKDLLQYRPRRRLCRRRWISETARCLLRQGRGWWQRRLDCRRGRGNGRRRRRRQCPQRRRGRSATRRQWRRQGGTSRCPGPP
jgi:hypothetical protein